MSFNLTTVVLSVLMATLWSQTSSIAEDDSVSVTTETHDQALHHKCVSILRDGLNSDEFWPSMHAAEGLTAAGFSTEVIAAITDRLTAEEDDQRRCGLARELVRAGQDSHLEVLFHVLGDLKSTGRTHAAESLYKLGHCGDRVLLKDAMKQQDVIPLQIMAAGALAKSGQMDAIVVLRKQLHSQDQTARNLSAWVLGREGDSDDINPVLEAMKAANDEMSRTFFAVSLACLGSAEGRATLIRQLDSPNPTARAMAAEFAGISRTIAGCEKLVRLLDDEVLDVRIRAAHSIIVLQSEQ